MTPCRYVARELGRLAVERDGATTIEYALIIFIVSLAIGFILPEMGASLEELFLRSSSAIDGGVTHSQGN